MISPDEAYAPLHINVRWADCDANRHVRHSAYADYAATARMTLFQRAGFDMDAFEALGVGPVLFREELRYRREVRMEDQVNVETRVAKLSPDGARWTIQHRLLRASDAALCATIEVDGAWIDIAQRKLITPPEPLRDAIAAWPKAEDA